MKKENWCVDCGNLRVLLGLEGRDSYWCVVRQAQVKKKMLWRRACKDFDPAPGPPAPPKPPKA